MPNLKYGMKRKLFLIALRLILWRVALWWCKSLRVERVGGEQFDRLRGEGKNYVVAFWHGAMLVGWFLHSPQKRKTVSALVSQSNDGEYLTAILEKWNYTMIRGSSHIGGKEALDLPGKFSKMCRGDKINVTEKSLGKNMSSM